MNAENILRSDVLDIIFENRNKQYGAYELRKQYNNRLYKAMSAMLLLVLSLIAWDYIRHNWNQHNNNNGVPVPVSDSAIILTPVEIPKEQPKPQTQVQPPPASIRDVVPRIVPDKDATDTMPTIDDKADKVISDKTVEGPPPTSDVQTDAPKATGPATEPAPEPVPEPKVVEVAEKMPQFPGDLGRFLGRYLNVPEGVLEPGQRIRVPVKFVVNQDGNLSDIEFIGQVDNAFKKEIMRVMSKMPKWTPGSQNGRLVAVYFTIPIVFEVPE